jgi:hypothetical protein
MVMLCRKYWNPNRDQRLAKPRQRREVIRNALCIAKDGTHYTSGVRVNKDGISGRNHIAGVRLKKDNRGAWVEQ